jgi:hypothetical protein
MAKFAYISQQHNLDSQVQGYIDNCKKLKTKPFNDPVAGAAAGGGTGGKAGAAAQEEGKGEEEVELTKVSKHLFTKDPLFEKKVFAAAFPEWSKEKLAYYYDATLTWSNEGNMKKDWKATVRTWALRDEKQGKIKFNVVTSSSQHDGIL